MAFQPSEEPVRGQRGQYDRALDGLLPVRVDSREGQGRPDGAEKPHPQKRPEQGAATALRALQSVDDNMKTAKIDLKAVYTNDFVRKANAKYPKG